MANGNVMMGSVEVAMADIPHGNLAILVQRSLNHIFKNERDAAVKVGANGDETQIARLREEWETAKRNLILTGVLGTRQGGPRLDPVEKQYRSLLLAYVKTTFAAYVKSKGLATKFPTDNETTVQIGKSTRTLPEMLAKAEASQGEELRKQAARIVNERNRATKAKVEAGSDGEADLGSVGL